MTLLYGSGVWTTAVEENVKNVFNLQKRAARVILDANFSERSAEIFTQLDWLQLKDAVNLQMCSLMFRRRKNEQDCPSYIMNLIPGNANTRSATRARRYGMYNLVCACNNRETEGGHTFQVHGV